MQNQSKAIYVSSYITFALVLSIYGFKTLVVNGFLFQTLAYVIVGIAVTFFFARLFIAPVARTKQNPTLQASFIGMGMMIGIYGMLTEPISMLSIGLLLSVVIGWIIYLKWYSTFDDRNENDLLKVGQILPHFSLENGSKKTISSDQFKGQPAIYIFYRGNWCPLCMAQIKEIAGEYQELEKRGVQTILVSPQPHKYSKSLAKKFNVGFHFLVDLNNKVARQLGILSENGLPLGLQVFGYENDTVLPTVLITDSRGKILFADLTDNYRIRPEPSTFLAILDGKEVELMKKESYD